MKRFIQKSIAMLTVGSGVFMMGCASTRSTGDVLDPCYFERYTSTARQETIASFAPQVMNGHVLDQTIWNYHFEAGSDKLTPGGYEKLDQLVRRRPQPDSQIFLQTARDVSFDANKADQYAVDQSALNAKRAVAIQKYLNAQTAGRPMQFDILVHDPSDPAIQATAARATVISQRSAYTGSLGIGAGGGGGSIGISGGGSGTGNTGTQGNTGGNTGGGNAGTGGGGMGGRY